MIERELYMKRIRPFIDTDLIKVMTGIRRSGKSVMLELVRRELMKRGRKTENFLCFNFEKMGLEHLRTARSLYDEIINAYKNINGKLFVGKIIRNAYVPK